MATVPFRDPEDARGEIDRLFAEMPGAPAALVLVVATRGRLGYVGSRDDPSRAADGATGAPGAPGTPHGSHRGRSYHVIEGGADAINEPAGLEAPPPPGQKTRTEGDAPARTRGAPHRSVGTGGNCHTSTRRK